VDHFSSGHEAVLPVTAEVKAPLAETSPLPAEEGAHMAATPTDTAKVVETQAQNSVPTPKPMPPTPAPTPTPTPTPAIPPADPMEKPSVSHHSEIPKNVEKPENTNVPVATEKAEIPKGAIIGKGNVSITHAFKMQLESDPELAKQLGYDVAKNKALFLKHLGEKLGYIGENGQDIGAHAGMGEAYVLHAEMQADGSFAPVSEEYQHGELVESHHAGDAFEGDTASPDHEKYEYVRNSTHQDTPAESVSSAYSPDTEIPEPTPDLSLPADGDVEASFNDSNEYSPDINQTPEFFAQRESLIRRLFGYRQGFFGPKVADSNQWDALRGKTMSQVLDKNANFGPELRRPLARLGRLLAQSKIGYSPSERLEEYLNRVAEIRTSR
jgi:hypothetical protein